MESTLKDWVDFGQAWEREKNERLLIDYNSLCIYGIRPLDSFLFRIGKDELVVIGAETGSGKSEIGLNIAIQNAKEGKRVAFYYLEGGWKEAIQRIKWREISNRYYKTYTDQGINMDFKRWVYNALPYQLLEDIEKEISEELCGDFKENLYFYPINEDFTVETFMMSLMSFNELLTHSLDLDLVIIDHLQYFSLTKAENEITEITKILREVKSITTRYSTPIILISHLRKRGKNSGLPVHEDFYGSGNIAKIANTAIMISPATDKDNLSTNIYPTYFRIVKSRTGVRSNYAFLTDFNLETRSYGKTYQIYKVNSMGEVSEEPLMSDELPRWLTKEVYMKEELLQEIDRVIERQMPIQRNKWWIYSRAKKCISDYELTKRIGFNPQEYNEYIDYITNKLKI